MSICSEFAELTEAVAILIILVNALGLMIGAVKPGEVPRNVALSLCLAVIVVTSFEVLLHLWEELTFLEKMGLATIWIMLVLRGIPRRRTPKRGKSRDAH